MATFEKIQTSRRLIGSAIKHDPEAVIAGYEPHMNIGRLATGYVYRQATGEEMPLDRPIDFADYVILTNGVNDIDSIVRHAAKNYNVSATQDEMIELFKHDDAIDVIAKHARCPKRYCGERCKITHITTR